MVYASVWKKTECTRGQVVHCVPGPSSSLPAPVDFSGDNDYHNMPRGSHQTDPHAEGRHWLWRSSRKVHRKAWIWLGKFECRRCCTAVRRQVTMGFDKGRRWESGGLALRTSYVSGWSGKQNEAAVPMLLLLTLFSSPAATMVMAVDVDSGKGVRREDDRMTLVTEDNCREQRSSSKNLNFLLDWAPANSNDVLSCSKLQRCPVDTLHLETWYHDQTK